MVPSALLFVSLVMAVGAHLLAPFPCQPCSGETCLIEPPGCKYGSVLFCGRKVCGRGPGQKCGGYHNENGKCGDGLKCECGVCRGCAYVGGLFECSYSDPAKCLPF